MREVKFRARYRGTTTWSYFTLGDLMASDWVEWKWSDWGQYIGIEDKNGTGIYEGDVVDLDNSDIGGRKVRGEVVFNTDQMLGNLEWGLWTDRGYMRTDFLGLLEVVGNASDPIGSMKETS